MQDWVFDVKGKTKTKFEQYIELVLHWQSCLLFDFRHMYFVISFHFPQYWRSTVISIPQTSVAGSILFLRSSWWRQKHSLIPYHYWQLFILFFISLEDFPNTDLCLPWKHKFGLTTKRRTELKTSVSIEITGFHNSKQDGEDEGQ